jgi:carboxymethylenebutenolidase
MSEPGSVPGALADPSAVADEEVVFAGAGGDEVRGFLARPREEGPWPGVIVIHEAFGLNGHIRDVARRIANVGYVALAPDLYTREGAPPPDAGLDAIRPLMLSQPDAQIVGDLEGAAERLRSRLDVTGAVGCIGFCSGGRQTLLFACSSDALDAAIDCWGGSITRASPDHETTPERPVPVIDLVPRLSCPLMAVIGAEDGNPSPADGELLRERLSGVDVAETRVDIYPDAGHAFFADYRPTYRPEAAARLWPEIVRFFGRHLGGGGAG